MAFSFGGTTTAAPAPSAFGAAPAPSSGGLFGSSTPAPAPATGGLFGSAPATAPAFGAPAAAPATGGLFGAAAPAPATGGLFGSTPAPAPATGGLFGATPAPAPATGGLFGSTPAPAFGAPATGGLFGSTPAPAPAFGAPATGGLFGSTPAPAPSAFGQPPPAPAANLAGYMPYSSLPQDQKSNIDTVYRAIMNHKRTILAVASMAPKLLDTSTQQADAAGGGQEVPLSVTVKRLTGSVQQLEQQLKSLRGNMMHTKQMYETSTTQAIRDAKWPTEFVATRVGVTLTSINNNNSSNERSAQAATSASSTNEEKKKAEEFNRHLKELLDREMTHADQIYRMPSPYLWQCVEEMEGRSRLLQGQLQSLKETLEISNEVSTEDFDVIRVIQLQEQTIWKVAADLTQVHNKVYELRQLYNLHEKGINVLEEARQEEFKYQQQMHQQMRTLMVKTLPATLPVASGPVPATGGGLFGSTTPTASTGGGLFGRSPAPATAGLFGAAPAPSSGGLFGSSTPAPAPAAGGLFGSAPAAAAAFGAPATGSLFGSATPAPAPAAGGLFGSTPAPAPVFGAPAPAASTFGGAAPAPTAGGLFGAPKPAAPAFGAPASGGLFGSTSTAAATPKSKSRSRSSSSRRR